MKLTKKEDDPFDWMAMPNELQAEIVGVLSKELFERIDDKESNNIPFMSLQERDSVLIKNICLAIQKYIPKRQVSIKKKEESPVSDDDQFRAVLLKDIPYFHKLYAKYKNPQFLELARQAGEIQAKIKNKTY